MFIGQINIYYLQTTKHKLTVSDTRYKGSNSKKCKKCFFNAFSIDIIAVVILSVLQHIY